MYDWSTHVPNTCTRCKSPTGNEDPGITLCEPCAVIWCREMGYLPKLPDTELELTGEVKKKWQGLGDEAEGRRSLENWKAKMRGG